MKTSSCNLTTSIIAITLAGLLSVSWCITRSPLDIELRRPGMDGTPQTLIGANASAQSTPIAGNPLTGVGVASSVSGAWLGFRGGNHDGVSIENVSLARQWPTAGPPQRWQVTLCEGYASAAVRDGRVYVLDYDDAVGADVVRCLSLDDGREIWSNGYPVAVTRNHGISRTTPVLVDDCVITIGPQCHVAGWDAETGVHRWLIDLPQEYQTLVPRWYAGQCPLVDQGRLILAPGGTALMIAVDPKTGEVIWKSDNPHAWQMTHGSIAVMQQAAARTYVYCASGGVVGVDARDGKIVWETNQWPVQFAHAPSPLVLPEGRVFVCSGYGNEVGAMMLRVDENSRQVSIERKFTPKEFNAEQQTPILFEDHIYGIRKRGGGQMVCLDLQGDEVWNSGRDRFGHGPYLIADGMLFVLSDAGELTIAAADSASYQKLASHPVFVDGHDAWGPMAIVAGNLIVRDMTRMVCLNVRATEEKSP